MGEGGTAQVFRVLDSKETHLAIKIFKRPFEARWLRRLRTEYDILSKLNHANIVKVYSGGLIEFSANVALVMQFIKGMTLRQYCTTSNLSELQALSLLISVCDGLTHAHDLRVIHRDIHAGNIILQDANLATPIIVDFGTARDFSIQQLEDHEEYQTFQPIGAMSHRAPEKWVSPYEVGPESDVFSLGVMIYRCLTGRMPYRSERSYWDLYRVIESGQHRSVRQIRKEITLQTSNLIDMMIDPDRLNRVPSAEEVKNRCVKILGGSPTINPDELMRSRK